MLRSLYSGVSGLTSHQTKMDVIGNNIANVNTYGFKGSRVTFRDIYYQTSKSASAGSETAGGVNSSQIGYGTTVASVDKNMSRSSFQSSSSSLDLAIAGEGFLQVQDKAGNKFYTRAGNLQVDNAGNLLDSTGKFVLGTQNGDPTVAEGLGPDAGTSKIKINVPSVHTAEATKAITVNPAITDVSTPDVTIGFLNGDQTSNITLTIADGGTAEDTVTTYTPPSAMTVTLKDAAKITDVETLANRINAAIEKEMKKTTGAKITDENFKGGKVSITMDMKGSKKTDAAQTALTSAEIKQLKSNAVTSLIAAPSAMTSVEKTQSFADLSSFSIGENGVLTGIHSVLGALTFGRIDLATFNNPTGLNEAGTCYFTESVASGTAKITNPGMSGSGTLVGSALEMSNVNLAQEFSDMITTQRGFQANSRIITTSDEILQELVNLKK